MELLGSRGLAFRHRVVEIYEPGGIFAPALLDADYGGDEIVLLLEFVDGRPGDQWAIADYAAASMALGRGQGRFLTGTPVPDHPWLSRGFLRDYSGASRSTGPCSTTTTHGISPWSGGTSRPSSREAAQWLHASRDRLYGIAEALPRVLCHLDFWTKNLIMRSDGLVVLLDWAFVGDGAIGEDIGNLVPDATFDHFMAAESLPDLERAVLEAYIEGLGEAGLRGDRVLSSSACAPRLSSTTGSLRPCSSPPRAAKQLRYGGTEEVDADYRFHERGLALLDDARRALRALSAC